MRPTVLLFDIDGTLVLTGGAGRRAMAGAFADAYGRGNVFEKLSFAGMTDRAIVRYGVIEATGTCSDAAIDDLLDRYLTRLQDELTRTEGYRVMPGVPALLSQVVHLENVAVGLGTGNIRKGAYAKLARGRLDGTFAFGGFGCDAEDRTELLRAGARRGAEALRADLAECRVVVIGDTPKDVAAAQGIGAECVGVGTGGFGPEALVAVGARWGFATLEEPGVRDAILGER